MTKCRYAMAERRIRVLVEPDGEEFHAYAPTLPGLHASGQTEEEAVENAAELVTVYLGSMLKHGDPLPALARIRQ